MAEVVELHKLKVGNTIILSLLYIRYTFFSEHNAKSLLVTDQVGALVFKPIMTEWWMTRYKLCVGNRNVHSRCLPNLKY